MAFAGRGSSRSARDLWDYLIEPLGIQALHGRSARAWISARDLSSKLWYATCWMSR